MVKIREMKYSDAEQFVKLRNFVWRSAYAHIFPEEVFVSRENAVAESIRFVQAWDMNSNGNIQYVAEEDSNLIGFMTGATTSQYSHFNGYADLGGLYIHPDYQGKGIGTKFFNIFKEKMRELGVTKFVIGVLRDNKKARLVYEKWGGVLDEYTRPYEKLGQVYDEVFYTFEI